MAVIPFLNVDVAELWASLMERIHQPKTQRRLAVTIVCVALLLDNMLYMVIVPIIPLYLDNDNSTETTNPTNPPLSVGENQPLQNLDSTPKPSSSQDGSASIGVLFASKAIVQLLINPLSGTVIDRMGYDRPMVLGLSILFLSTSIFAFGKSYGVLFMARSLQGVGSAFADTSGLAMLADIYKEESSRLKAQGLALAFISFGCLFAPPFGGFLYEFAGKAVPFLILSLVALVDGALLYIVMQPQRKERQAMSSEDMLKGTPIYRLILDPYIAVCAGALVMANVSLAFLEPTIAVWMNDTMQAEEWQIGFVWLPAFFPHVLGVYLTVKLMGQHPEHQWIFPAVGLVLEGLSCLIIPFCKSYGVLIIPIMLDCFGIALIDTAVLPMLAYLVDTRHTSVYGSIYAIADISYSLAYAFGPILAGGIVNSIGFTWLNVGICLSNLIYAPLLIFLRNAHKYNQFKDEDDTEDSVLVHNMPGGQYKTYVMNNMTGTTPKEQTTEEGGKNLNNGHMANGQTPNPIQYQTADPNNTRTIRYERDSVESDSDFQSYR